MKLTKHLQNHYHNNRTKRLQNASLQLYGSSFIYISFEYFASIYFIQHRNRQEKFPMNHVPDHHIKAEQFVFTVTFNCNHN